MATNRWYTNSTNIIVDYTTAEAADVENKLTDVANALDTVEGEYDTFYEQAIRIDPSGGETPTVAYTGTLADLKRKLLGFDVDGNLTTFPDTGFTWTGDASDIDIDGMTDIGAALADEDLIIVDDGASGTNRKSALSRVWTWIKTKVDAPLSMLDIDAGTDIGADLVDADLIIVDDGASGTNRKSELSRVKTYISSDFNNKLTPLNLLDNAMMSVNEREFSTTGSLPGSVGNNKLHTLIDRWGFDKYSTGYAVTATLDTAPSAISTADAGITINVTLADASPDVDAICSLTQGIDGRTISHLKYGTSAARDTVVRFKLSGTGLGASTTYTGCISIISLDATPVSYVQEFTYTSDGAGDVAETTVTATIPAETAATWLAGDQWAAEFNVCLGAGSNYTGGTNDTWVAGTHLATTNITNLYETTGSVTIYEPVWMVGSVVPADPPVSHYELERVRCQRYFQRHPRDLDSLDLSYRTPGGICTAQFEVPAMIGTPTASIEDDPTPTVSLSLLTGTLVTYSGNTAVATGLTNQTYSLVATNASAVGLIYAMRTEGAFDVVLDADYTG